MLTTTTGLSWNPAPAMSAKNIKPSMDLSKMDFNSITAIMSAATDSNSPILSLSLKQIPLVEDNGAFESLVALINTNTHLKNLNLWGCSITDDLLRRLCWAISNPTSKSTLNKLNLGYNNITAEGVRQLADACWNSATLSKVTVGSSEIPIDVLKQAQTSNDGAANLSKLGVGPLSAILVGVLIRRTSGMKLLNLSDNNLRKEGTNFLCRELAHYEDLMSLDISHNEIFPSGVEAIASMLRGAGGGLEELNLGKNTE